MRTLGNILWFFLAGWELFLGYVIAGLVAFVLIITIPFGVASFRIAGYVVWPFGRTVVRKPSAGVGSAIGNVIWLVLFGWWLALIHVVTGLLLAITIIGIPFAIVHVKLAGLALRPYGKDVVEARFADQHEVVLAPPRALGGPV
jgi:uncharacterized membrane protein YccF (DUF307 family)